MAHRRVFAAALLASLSFGGEALAQRTTQEYRFFRALSIDLQGRIPLRAEVAAFERPDFDVAAWIDAHLTTPEAAERLRRVYTERLRLEVSTTVRFLAPGQILRRVRVRTARGFEWVYFRSGQRRANVDIDGTACFTPAELGVKYPRTGDAPEGVCNAPRMVTDALLNARTQLVRPWWLYRDYRAATPADRYDAARWETTAPGYQLVDAMLGEERDPVGMPRVMTPLTAIRVCNEEAQNNDSGVPLMRTTAAPPLAAGTDCDGRSIAYPNTNGLATQLGATTRQSCATNLGFALSAQCGCGVGLERCMPGAAVNNQTAGALTVTSTRAPIGDDLPLAEAGVVPSDALSYYWSQEAVHLLDGVFQSDRPVSDILTARDTYINGPLAQFYRGTQEQACCSASHAAFGYTDPTSLFEPGNVPATILPHDVSRWTHVADRGALASGILTTPIFATKYGTRRARAHVLYQAFACREFTAPNAALMPSTQPNLTVRSGCQGCHATLEPLAAYFTRVAESDWTYLPRANFPLDVTRCRTATPTASMPSGCLAFYDPQFTAADHAWMRGMYGADARNAAPHPTAMANAEAGPRGAGAYFAGLPEFRPCVVENVAESILGRELDPEDAALRAELERVFSASGGRARAMVRALLLSDAYRRANNLSATAWREMGGSR